MTCDANMGELRFEAYCDGRFIGAADSLEDCEEYEPCCDGRFEILDTADKKCYRVWANGAAVLVDAWDEDDARCTARRHLNVSDAEIDTVECLD